MSSLKKLSMATAGAALIVLGTVGGVQAATFTIFNTGVDNNNNVLDNGSEDSHYTVDFSSASTDSAFVTEGLDPYGGWMQNNSTSKWIGRISTSNSADGDEAGSFTYRTTFDLTGLNHSTAFLSGRLAVDDYFTGIVLNGEPVLSAAPGGSGTFSEFYDFTISSGFNPGINTLEFNAFNTDGPTGFRAEFTQATGDPIATPVPFEFSPGLGILALGAWGAMIQLNGIVKKRKSSGSAFSNN